MEIIMKNFVILSAIRIFLNLKVTPENYKKANYWDVKQEIINHVLVTGVYNKKLWFWNNKNF